MNNRPRLSIVIAATRSKSSATRTAASLGPLAESVEVVSVFEEGLDLPKARAVGLRRSKGAIVGFVEDGCAFEPNWIEAVLSTFEDPSIVLGTGSVLPPREPETGADAEYFFEYSPFGAIDRGPPSARPAGLNFFCRRRLVEGLNEMHEWRLPATAKSIGGRYVNVPFAAVRFVSLSDFPTTARERFQAGRAFGKMRWTGRPTLLKLLGIAGGALILPLQVGRITRDVLRGGSVIARFARAFPKLLILTSCWSLGEWLGWFTAPGRPGSPLPGNKRREKAARPRTTRYAPAESRR